MTNKSVLAMLLATSVSAQIYPYASTTSYPTTISAPITTSYAPTTIPTWTPPTTSYPTTISAPITTSYAPTTIPTWTSPTTSYPTLAELTNSYAPTAYPTWTPPTTSYPTTISAPITTSYAPTTYPTWTPPTVTVAPTTIPTWNPPAAVTYAPTAYPTWTPPAPTVTIAPAPTVTIAPAPTVQYVQAPTVQYITPPAQDQMVNTACGVGQFLIDSPTGGYCQNGQPTTYTPPVPAPTPIPAPASAPAPASQCVSNQVSNTDGSCYTCQGNSYPSPDQTYCIVPVDQTDSKLVSAQPTQYNPTYTTPVVASAYESSCPQGFTRDQNSTGCTQISGGDLSLLAETEENDETAEATSEEEQP